MRPLAHSLSALGLAVWYDEFSLRLGQSLSESIDEGLRDSRRGILVVTPSFLRRRWPESEYRALLQREMDEGNVIVPIWHGVARHDVQRFSPLLADKFALVTTGMTAADVAMSLCRELRPDLYADQDHDQGVALVREAEGAALQAALDKATEETRRLASELSEFQCDVCGAPLIEAGPVRLSEDVDGSYEVFACGRVVTDARPNRPCPNSPDFPSFESFELTFFENDGHVVCIPRATSESGKGLEMGVGHGQTRDEAIANLRQRYDWMARPWAE